MPSLPAGSNWRPGCVTGGLLAALTVVLVLSASPRGFHQPSTVLLGLQTAAELPRHKVSTLAGQGNESFSFLIVCDWGGEDDEVPLNLYEQEDARGMGEVASQLKPRFVLALGDNFYHAGVNSKTAAVRFQMTFEQAFTAPSLHVPFYAIAGNHDHLGDVGLQIAYTGQGSGRWQFPESYYAIKQDLPDGKRLEIVMFDSVVAVGYSYEAKNGSIVRPEGPFDPVAAEQQWAWVEAALASSTADYLFTASHYPMQSICRHGSIMEATRLRQLLKRHRVSGHLAGHDHCLQHFEEDGIHYVGSGAGSRGFYSKSWPAPPTLRFHLSEENKGEFVGGFASMVIRSDGAQVFYYGNDGTVLYASDVIQPQTRAMRVHV